MKETTPELLDRMVMELRGNGCISSDNVAQAFCAVPRHLFLPGVPLDDAYGAARAIPTHFDERGLCISSSSAPNIMAIMLEQLSVQPGQRVLEIGSGTGYNSGLLARLVGNSGAVVSIDLAPEIAREAVDHLAAAGISGIDVVVADGWLGAPDGGQFDRIIATVQVWDISPHWVRQLRSGGTLVVPLWIRPGVHAVVAFEKTDVGLVSKSLAYCWFMPFRGPHASPPSQAIVPDWAGNVQSATDSESIAVFDEATPQRIEILRRLLEGSCVTRTTPTLFPGWNIRLALEEPDAIVFMRRSVGWFGATGLFDALRGSLALIDGVTSMGFGDPSSLERMFASLDRAVPFDLATLRITAVPHGTGGDEAGEVVLDRPSFDLQLEGLSA
jgi:methyltransferase of FxLD system